MATLHTVVDGIKTLFKIGIIFLFIVLSVVLFFRMKEVLFPAQKPPPEQKFGALPAIQFPENNNRLENITYVIDTVTGELPTFPDRIKVYQIEEPKGSLLASQKASEKLSEAGFKEGPIIVTETTYRWVNTTPPQRTILYDILSFNFELFSDYVTNAVVVAAAKLGTEDAAINTAIDFLSLVGSNPSDLDPEKTKTTLLAIQDLRLVPATSLSTAQIIRVDFFQKDIDGTPIVYPQSQTSPMQILVGSGDFLSEVVSGKFFHQTISETASEYPLVSAQTALDALKDGNAYFVSSTQNNQTIAIKNIYLAYYMSDAPQKYLTPVVVFEAENGFLAYVPAISQ